MANSSNKPVSQPPPEPLKYISRKYQNRLDTERPTMEIQVRIESPNKTRPADTRASDRAGH